ncbi:MAG: glycoside hydrolase family 31 protein [Prevotellaceae bacterium]|nr:glycoside hydrolase family 31 protein [Prevotellaceae bacterium]
MKTKSFLTVLLATSCAILLHAQKNVEVEFYSDCTVRILKQAPNRTPMEGDNLSLVVTAKPSDKVKVKKQRKGNTLLYMTPKLTVSVDETSGTVSFADAKGTTLLTEAGFGFENINEGPEKGRCKVSQTWALDADEPIYGLGMLQNRKMNQRGENRLMTQSNTEDYANFFQSIKGYGVYWDNYSPTQITDTDNRLTLSSQVGTKVDYYFLYGKSADGVIAEMRSLTGKVPMLPLWTYGFHQSRERYKSCSELTEVVDTYKKTGVPFDGIIQDWQYWGSNYLWNAMEFNSEDFKDYKKMIDHVHDIGKHITISIWASFGPHTKPYKQLDDKGLLYSFRTWPPSGLSFWPPRMDYPSGVRCYDPYSSEARGIYWQNLTRLHKAGIDAWWMDSTDPDHTDAVDTDLDEVRPITDPKTGKDFSASWRYVRNAFPLATVEGVYNAQRAADSTKRVFILTRSYFAGQQRTGAQTWSGDVGSNWDSFRKQIPLCLNYTLTANPMVNTDLGGFFANSYNKHWADTSATRNPLYQELYVRWMQFGTFSSMMRSHGTEVFRELYFFGKKGEPVYDALLDAVKLRYQLLPYIYSTSWQVSRNNDSFMRALMMDFKDDKLTWDNNREFMFGRSLLVAPIVKALFTPENGFEVNGKRTLFKDDYHADWSAKKTYEVYLPAGTKWYDFFTGETYEGGQTVNADGTLMHCPVFVKAGTILPLCKRDVDHADIADWQTLNVNIYPGCDASFTLYEDEGDNYNYEHGAYSTIDFKWNDRTSTLTISPRKGSFAGMKSNRTFIVTNLGKEKTVNYNGKKTTVKF